MVSLVDYSPWTFWAEADATARAAQLAVQQRIAGRPSHVFGDNAFVSDGAAVDTDALSLGDRSYIAAGAYLTGSLRVGSDCSINPYTVIRGRVELGDGVRIGAHTSILGFNHVMSDPDLPVFRQPLVTRGIVVGDDVWIGSHVVVLDGVRVGSRSVLAAGAVVTKDVADGAIVGGNPARFMRWRVPPAEAAMPVGADLAARVAAFGVMAREQARAVLDRSWNAELDMFIDHPGAPPTVRAQCDAIEIADLLLGTAPPQLALERQIERLREWQDPVTGAVAPLDPTGAQHDGAVGFTDPDSAYHVLAVGYALDLLGSGFPAPLANVAEATAAEIAADVVALPWASNAWGAGHQVDALGTALLWSIRRGDRVPVGVSEALFGRLLVTVDPQTGMWGDPDADGGLMEMVNGFYRATRGTFAQFGVPLPHSERVVDTVLRHLRDQRYFAPDRRNACNVLDVAHPLWLTRAGGYRGDEVTATARALLSDAIDTWIDGEGFSFHVPGDGASDEERIPGLQGTEMWLAIIWYLADLAGFSEVLGYRPRGVHRPEPATRLSA